ncbi:hypothetical protein V8C26DRAFT_413705 [Trichoderma gracile]
MVLWMHALLPLQMRSVGRAIVSESPDAATEAAPERTRGYAAEPAPSVTLETISQSKAILGLSRMNTTELGIDRICQRSRKYDEKLLSILV